MAETIRDVTIRIGIKQEAAILKAPDIRKFQTAIQKLQKESQVRITLQAPDVKPFQTAINRLKEETQTVLSGASRITIPTPDTSGMEDAVDGLEDRFDDALEALAQGEKEAAKATERATQKIKAQQEEVVKLKSETLDFNIKAAEGFKTAGAGVFQLARSTALLTSSGEDLQVMIERIAMLQAGFDAFSGTIDLTKGMVEGIRALRAASVAAAAAQTAHAAATAAVGTASAAALPPVVALETALSKGKIGLILTGITVAMIAVAAAIAYFTSESKKAGDQIPEDLSKIAEAQRKLNEELRKRQEISDHFLKTKTGKFQLQAKIDELKVSRDQLTIQQQIAQIEARKTKNFGFKSVDKLTEDAKGFRFGEFNAEAGLSSAKELEAVLGLQIESERQKLSLIQKQQTIKDKSLQQAKTELETLKQTLAAEEGRKQSLQERVGRLDPKQQRQFGRLSEKVKGGKELSPGELKQLESLGGSGVAGFTSKKFQQIGQQRGASDLFKPFGTDVNKDIAGTKGQIEDKQGDVRGLVDEVKEAIEKRRNQERESADRLAELFVKEAGAKGQIEYLEQRIQEIRGQ